MDSSSEINVLKVVIDALQPLDEEARGRVLDYVSKVFKCRPMNAERAERPLDRNDSAERSQKPIGPQEYLRKYKYKSMTRRIGVVAVFIERERKIDRINYQSILKEFKDAKEPKLPVHVQFARAVASNYLAKDGELYYATSAAEALVDAYRSDAEDTEG